MGDQDDSFSNPIVPVNVASPVIKTVEVERQNLSNEDFRKLLMTPRTGSASGPPSSRVLGSVRSHRKPILNDQFKIPSTVASSKATEPGSDSKERKAKKKSNHSVKTDTDDTLSELAKKYRDRAKERRENANPDYQVEEDIAALAYQAVAPPGIGVKEEDAAERRRQLIEESKFLGGDMKHTHLVKGLDFALLQKVKAEIEVKEEEELEKQMEQAERKAAEAARQADLQVTTEKELENTFRTSFARNVVSAALKLNRPISNELFAIGRMVYQYDLEDPLADDVPTTVIRSKADLPNWQANATLSTNDIVIGKLITIFTEWRQSGGKRKRKEATSQELNMKTKNISKANELNELAVSTNRLPTILKEDDIGIYDDIGDYELPQRRARSLSNSSDELQYSKRRSSRHEKSRDFRSSQAKRDYLHGYTSLATNSITDPQEEASLNFDVIRPPSTDSDDEPEKKHESYVPMKSNSNFTCAQNQSTDSSNSPSPTRSMSLSPVAKRSRHRRAASSRSSSNSSRSSSRSKTRSNRGDRSSRRRTRSRSKDRKHRSSSEHRSRRRSRSSERYRSDRDRSSHHSLHYPKTASSSRHRSRR